MVPPNFGKPPIIPRMTRHGLYKGYIGIMEKKMETTIMDYMGLRALGISLPSFFASVRPSLCG